MESHPADGPTSIFKVSTCCLGRQWLPHFIKLWPPKFTKKKKAITCCKGCATKIKKKLKKINGVNSITIDYEKGMVGVSGEVDPTIILVTISKLKIMTELLSYKKDPHGALKKKQAQRKKKKNAQNLHHQTKDSKKNGHDDHHHDHDHSKPNPKSRSDSGSDDDFDQGYDHNARKIRKANMNDPLVPQGKGYSRPQIPPARYGPQNDWSQGMYGKPPPGPPPALLPPPMPSPAYGYGHHSNMAPQPRPPPPHVYPYYRRPKERPQVGNSVFHYFSDDNTNGCTIM